MLKKILFCTFIFSISCKVYALEYLSSSLTMMDYEGINSIVQSKINEAYEYEKDTQEYIDHIREAAEVIFSRPDVDSKRSSLYLNIVRNLTPEAEVVMMKSLVKNALSQISKTTNKVENRSTYYVVLDNVLHELEGRKEIFKDIYVLVRDSKIKLDKDLKNFRLTKMSAQTGSLQKEAKRIIGKQSN